MSGEVKYYIGIIIAIFTIISTVSAYLYYIRQAKRIVDEPESIPEVATEIIEEKYVNPIVRKAETITKVARFIASLPPIVIIMLVIAYSMLKK